MNENRMAAKHINVKFQIPREKKLKGFQKDIVPTQRNGTLTVHQTSIDERINKTFSVLRGKN